MALLFLLLKKYEKCFFRSIIQGDSWMIMNTTELRMQPTIQLDGALRSKCIVGCIFNSVGVIISYESPCIQMIAFMSFLFVNK
jgi:hypothetical protein